MVKNLSEITEVASFFIKGEKGPLFATYYPPANGKKLEQFILHIPAFAEEMNKSRRMVALQAREFSKCGYGVFIVDLFGTGDSEGEFHDASWQVWKNDLKIIYQYLTEQGNGLINLWMLRTGALLGMEVASESNYQFQKLLLWQPVLDGKTFVMQFLRLRVAAAMMNNKNSQQEKTSDLIKQLSGGKQIEVAGYMLSPELVNPLVVVDAKKIKNLPFEEIILFEITKEQKKTLSPAFTRFQQVMQEKGNNIFTRVVAGNSFWIGQEISEIPELLVETVNCFSIGQ